MRVRNEGYYFDAAALIPAGERLFSPEDAVKVGRALGRMHPRGIIGAAAGSSAAARAILAAATAGAAGAGAVVWEFGECFDSQFTYCVSRSGADFGIYADGAETLRIYSRGGLPPSVAESRKLLDLLETGGSDPASPGDYGTILSMPGLRELYRVELVKSAVCSLAGMTVSVKCPGQAVQSLLEDALTQLGCRLGEDGITLQVSADGRNVSVYQTVSDYIFTDRVLLLCCMDLFRRGQDVSVPASAPRVLDRLAAERGRRAFRYEDGFSSPDDRSARHLGIRQPFLRDGLMLGIRLLSLLKENRCSLEELERRLPSYGVVSRTVPAGQGLLPDENGICLAFREGEIRLRPVRAGRAVFLAAEGRSVELAGELCRFAEEELQQRRLPQPDSPLIGKKE